MISAQRKSVHFTVTVRIVCLSHPQRMSHCEVSRLKVGFVSGFLGAPPRSRNGDVGLRLGERQQNSVQSCGIGLFTPKLLVVQSVVRLVRPSVCIFNSLHILATS